MPAVFLAFMSFLATITGGWVAIRNRKRLHYILGFTAGIILGVIAFDLLPEIFELVHHTEIDPVWPMIALVSGFLLFHIFEKLLLLHHAHEDEYGPHRHPQVGVLSALALSAHSFLDGMSIGLGFQISPAVGVAVAVAVISHAFADGLNTITLMLNHKNSVKKAIGFLLITAAAPVLGAASTLLFQFSDTFLTLYLGFFAGFLLYIGASDILPQAHEKHSSRITIGLTILGVLFIFLITRFTVHAH